MKAEKTITYSYDPTARSLTVIIDGKPAGGFIGPDAESRFNELLGTGANITITNMATEAKRTALIRRFHAALAKQGIMGHKEEILSGYGVEHTSELSDGDLKELVERYSQFGEDESRKTKEVPAKVRSLRSDLLTVMNKLGVYVTNGDWGAVNNFCMKHAGKLLYQMDASELRKALRQFNAILDWSEKKRAETERKKMLN